MLEEANLTKRTFTEKYLINGMFSCTGYLSKLVVTEEFGNNATNNLLMLFN